MAKASSYYYLTNTFIFTHPFVLQPISLNQSLPPGARSGVHPGVFCTGREVLPWLVTIRFLWLRLEPPKVVESERPVVPKRKTGAATLPQLRAQCLPGYVDQQFGSRQSRRFPRALWQTKDPQALTRKRGLKSCN